MLKIPTGGKQTSWLFTKRGLGFENGATVKQIQVARASKHLLLAKRENIYNVLMNKT